MSSRGGFSAILGAWLVQSCLTPYAPEQTDPSSERSNTPITPGESLPGEPCNTAGMVRVEGFEAAPAFCIDRYEASLDGGALGNAHQSSGDDAATALDGSTQARARVALGVPPSTNISWYQAKAACTNAGKRLCTLAEWERACRGPDANLYPYGDTVDHEACNGFFQPFKQEPANTGAFRDCGSAYGAFDMSGNVEEWTATAVEATPGSGVPDARALRGGSFRSNSKALACVGPEFHAAPGSTAADRGFRCCRNLP